MLNSKISSKIGAIILGVSIVWALSLIENQHSLTSEELDRLIERQFFASQFHQVAVSEDKTSYIINKGNGDVLVYEIVPSENSTVFSLLEDLSQREGFEVESTMYEGMGVFVESIDGLENGTDNKYWQYWVNDELPQVAADKTIITVNDIVEWKFEITPF